MNPTVTVQPVSSHCPITGTLPVGRSRLMLFTGTGQSFLPSSIILVTGVYAAKPHIPGAEQEFVSTVTPILLGEVKPAKQNIVLVGSGINIEELKGILAEKNVRFITSTKLKEIGNHTVLVEHKDGTTEEFPADTVVLSLGSRKNDSFIKDLQNGPWKFEVFGDAGKVGRIVDATRSAYQATRNLS